MLPLDRQNAYRERYRHQVPGWAPATERYATLARRYVTPAARVLDVGCGRGGLIEVLADAVALPAGVDPDQAALAAHRAPGVRRARAWLERLPYGRGTFELVIGSWVLEHLSDPAGALVEIARVLAPGGHFVFLTPNARHPVVRANRLLMGRWQRRLVRAAYGRAEADTFPAYYRANTPAALAQLARAAGLAVRGVDAVTDPTYLAFNEPLFRLSLALERALPAGWRAHLVGDLQAPGGPL